MPTDEMKSKESQPGKRLLTVSSILLLVLSGLLVLLGAFLGMVGGGEWFALARPVSLLLLLSAAWNLALGLTGLAAGRRAGRGLVCIIMGGGGLSLAVAAVLLLLSAFSVLDGQSPVEDQVTLLLLLLPWMLLTALHFAGVIRNRRAGRPAAEEKEGRRFI